MQHDLQEDILEQETHTQLSTTPLQHTSVRAASARPATVAKRFSPDRTPLRNRVLNQRAAKTAFVGRVSDVHSLLQETAPEEVADETPSRVYAEPIQPDNAAEELEESIVVNIMGDNDEPDEVSVAESTHEQQEPEPEPAIEPESEAPEPPIVENDYSDEDQTFEPPSKPVNQRTAPNKANSRRKRKSDAIEDAESAAATSPVAKRAKRKSNEAREPTPPKAAAKKTKPAKNTPKPQEEPSASHPARGRNALAKKDANKKLSSQRQKEVDEIVEKIRARPSAPKSLFILRRETPADDTVTHTRSGRISIKPLAYWQNERCIFSDSPKSAGIEDGARFPMKSIKEIVRADPAPESSRTKSKKSKNKGKGKNRARADEDDHSDLDLASDGEVVDPDADEWELKSGTLKGEVASWDIEHQTGAPEEPLNIEIAHAHAAIQTKDVKGSTFKYAKLLSTRFFGAGVVDLPGGGVKRAKNSRKMHMCFFVVQGRVTVRVGALGGQDGDEEDWGTRFSIGKGGFWQVPRGKFGDPFCDDCG